MPLITLHQHIGSRPFQLNTDAIVSIEPTVMVPNQAYIRTNQGASHMVKESTREVEDLIKKATA